MIKHVGRHGDKRVVVLYRTVPDQEHMCLVCYSDLLPRTYHDSLMRVVESDAGQQATELAEAVHRELLPDGRNALVTLHREGLIKRIPTNQVIMTPDTRNSVRLDELNDILKKMSEGEDAVRRMAELDAQAGLKDPAKKSRNLASAQESTAQVITDQQLIQRLLEQAQRMRAEANTLLTEAQRLESQASADQQQLQQDIQHTAEQLDQEKARKLKNAAAQRRRRKQQAVATSQSA